MALTEITQGTAFWQPFRPDYYAATLAEIEQNAAILVGKLIQLPDRSVYYVDSNLAASLAFDEYLRPQFISGGTPPSPTDNFFFIEKKADLPTPVNGVITLAANATYYFTAAVDLTGDRIVASANTTILGASSENCSLTSTGLVSDYLITSDYTLPIRHITFKDVPLCISINADGQGAQPIALDWTGVNFLNCVFNVTCGQIDNFIFSKGAVLNGGVMQFLGTVGTIGIDNSLFVGSGNPNNILIEIGSSAVVTRRLRIIYSSFVVFGSTIGIETTRTSTIPTDSYILDTCNFSGGGTYLAGWGQFFTDNQPRFVNNKGITNTSPSGNMYFTNNNIETVISAQGTPTKILGTTTPNTINQKFTHSDNRLTYVGALSDDFMITAVISFTGTGNNKRFGVYIAKNGAIINDSEMYATTDGNNRAESVAIQTITSIEPNDYFEVWIENDTDSTNVTVQYMNCVIRKM